MFFDLKSYLAGKHGGAYTPSADLPSYLMGRAKSGGIRKITGTLPLVVRSRASQVLENYRIYGASGGVGDKTVNLFDKDDTRLQLPNCIFLHTFFTNSQTTSYTPCFVIFIPVTGGYTYSFSISQNPSSGGVHFASVFSIDKPTIGGTYAINGRSTYIDHGIANKNFTRTAPAEANWMAVQIATADNLNNDIMIVQDSTALASYTPYGYKLPITVTAGGTTTDYPIYIGDSQLMEGEYVNYKEQKIYKLVDGTLTPTDPPVLLPDIALPEGEVTIDIEGSLKPQATIKGLIEQI